MKIEKVRVRNFRSLQDSGEVKIDEKTTTMVGKNESGKTNFLRALESINRDYEYSDDEFCYYSGASNKKNKDIRMTTIWFETDDTDKERLKEAHKELAKVEKLKVTKYFDDHYDIETVPRFDIIKPILKNSKSIMEAELQTLTNALVKHGLRLPPFASAIPAFEKARREFSLTDLFDVSNTNEAFNLLYKEIAELPNQDAPIQEEIASAIQRFDKVKAPLISAFKINDKILELLPNFIYFENPDLLQDVIDITQYKKSPGKYKTFSSLEQLANIDFKELASEDEVFNRRFETDIASTTITGMMNESWTQDKVDVKIGIDGKKLFIFVEDQVGGYDPPSKRSDGFQWFLSFYINFMAGSKGKFQNTVLLLDNPGVYLHPSGQRDLLKTLEKIAKNNQIIFTTHSPFLIDRKNLRRIRLVLKKGYKKGTVIEEKLHHSNFDTLEPIRAAIGMSLGDTLFPFKNNLVVEGYSDSLILDAMSLFCSRMEENHLKPDISVIHAGTDRIPFFSVFFEKEGISYAVLLDNDSEGRRVEKQLIEEYGIEGDIIIKIDDWAPSETSSTDSEIEDLISLPLYNRAVNEAYREILEKKGLEQIKIEDLDTSINKQTKKYVKFFKDIKLGGLNKIMVAKQVYNILSDKDCTEDDVGKTTLRKFTKLFQLINTKFP